MITGLLNSPGSDAVMVWRSLISAQFLVRANNPRRGSTAECKTRSPWIIAQNSQYDTMTAEGGFFSSLERRDMPQMMSSSLRYLPCMSCHLSCMLNIACYMWLLDDYQTFFCNQTFKNIADISAVSSQFLYSSLFKWKNLRYVKIC